MLSPLIVDTSALLATFTRSPLTAAILRVLHGERQPPVLPPPIAAEMDYMISARRGRNANDGFLRDLANGRFVVPCLEPADYIAMHTLNAQYRDLDPGLADLSVVVMAARYHTTRVLTLDQHFRVLRPLQGGAFTLLPADA